MFNKDHILVLTLVIKEIVDRSQVLVAEILGSEHPGFILSFSHLLGLKLGLLGGSAVKNRTSGDAGSIPGSGRSPGVGHGNPLQYSCLENSMDRRAWRARV